MCQAVAANSGPRSRRLAVKGSRVLDPSSGGYLTDRYVLVEGARIVGVTNSPPAEYRLLDVGDRTIAPGLIDAHTHVFLHGNLLRKDFERQILDEYAPDRAAHAVGALATALGHGFTTIRDLETEGAGYGDVGLREAVSDAVLPGPRMLVAGPGISSTGTYPIARFRPDWRFPVGVDVIDGADGCRRVVR